MSYIYIYERTAALKPPSLAAFFIGDLTAILQQRLNGPLSIAG